MTRTKSALAIAMLMTVAACLQHGVPAAATPGPEADCAEACRAHASGCSDAACARGCRLAMDRLVEREQRSVIACLARASKTTCDDMTFAECAARSGPYVNGGPMPPKPPSSDDE